MRNMFLGSALAALLMSAAAAGLHVPAAAAPTGRATKKLRDVVGPATNWPSGKVHKRRSHYPDGQHPKFPKERKRRQHVHALRDEHGAFTLVGARHHGHRGPLQNMRSDHPTLGAMSVQAGRRVWLAGISAQRGY